MLTSACDSCGESITGHDYLDLALDRQEFERLMRLQRLFSESGRIRVHGSYLATDRCKIYRSLEKEGIIHAWQVVAIASPDGPSPIFSTCEVTMTQTGDAVQFVRCESSPFTSDPCEQRSVFFTYDGLRWDCTGDGNYSPAVNLDEANERIIWWPCNPEQSKRESRVQVTPDMELPTGAP